MSANAPLMDAKDQRKNADGVCRTMDAGLSTVTFVLKSRLENNIEKESLAWSQTAVSFPTVSDIVECTCGDFESMETLSRVRVARRLWEKPNVISRKSY